LRGSSGALIESIPSPTQPGTAPVPASARSYLPAFRLSGSSLDACFAEAAVNADVKAGFALADCPEIRISGRLRHDRKTGMDIPEDIRAHVTLWFRPPPEP
jgi:hypothetical protein